MIILNADNPLLPDLPAYVLVARDWQVSTDLSFSPEFIIAESLADTDMLEYKIFNITPDVGTRIYSRSRIICTAYISDWSVIDSTIVEDLVKLSFDNDIPSLVRTPIVTVDAPNNQVPASGFTVTTNPFSTTSNANHKGTTYLIETMDREPVFTDILNQDDLTTKTFDGIILDSGVVYLLHVAHHSSSGDVSGFASSVIRVTNDSNIEVTSDLENVNTFGGYTLTIAPIDNFLSLNTKLHAVTVAENILVHEVTEESLSTVILMDVFDIVEVTTFLLELTVTYQDGTVGEPTFFKMSTTD